MGLNMTDATSGDERVLHGPALTSELDDLKYTLPMLPKIGLAINLNAAILLFIPIILITLVNRQENVHSIVILSKLIFCFWIGVAAAVFSGVCDYGARRMYAIERVKKGFFWKCADLLDYSAVGTAVASMAIFCWCAWYVVLAMKDVALNL